MAEREEVVEMDICAVEPKEQEEITVDSGAGKCVWPRTKKEGGPIRKLEKKVKLMAANGQEMPVDGEKVVRFETDGRKCGMRFLVTDTKKPLAAVSSIVDEGNVVVFGPGPWGSFIQNVHNGEKIFMTRKKGTYVIQVDYGGEKRKAREVDTGGRRAMDVGAAEVDDETVFNGQK